MRFVFVVFERVFMAKRMKGAYPSLGEVGGWRGWTKVSPQSQIGQTNTDAQASSAYY